MVIVYLRIHLVILYILKIIKTLKILLMMLPLLSKMNGEVTQHGIDHGKIMMVQKVSNLQLQQKLFPAVINFLLKMKAQIVGELGSTMKSSILAQMASLIGTTLLGLKI